MESFYGGRQGASFVIKKKFKYLDTSDPSYLVDKPADTREVMSEYVINPENKDFWYGEYCIIDTTNKNNPNNGKIYRRTIVENLTGKDDYPNAEYVGQIVGPSSGAAFLKPQAGLLDFGKMRGELVGDWDGLGVKVGTELVTYDPSFKKGETAGTTWPTSVDLKPESVNIESGLSQGVAGTITKKAPVWNKEHQRYDITTTVAGASWDEDKKKFVNEQDTDTPSVRDDIQYNWFNVRKNTENDEGVVESWCYLGFDIPATTFTAEAIHITPGIQPKVVETENSKNHPFWYDFRFEIPGGLRGASVKRIYNNDNGATYPENSVDPVDAYSFDQLIYNKETDTYCIDPENSDFEFGPMEEKAWFCDIEFMNFNSAEGAVEPIVETKTFFMGYVVEVEHIDLDPKTGHVTIIYHNKLQESWDLRYPIDVNMNEKTGRVITTYSVGEEQEDGSFVHETKTVDFKYPINVAINEGNGNVKVIYSLPVDYEEDGTPVVDEEGNIVHQSDEWNFRYPKQFNFTPATDEDYQGLDSEEPVTYNTGYYKIDYSCGEDESGQFGFVRKVSMTEGADYKKGSITFVNTIEGQNQTYDFSYPKTLEFYKTNDLYDGRWKIDYYGAEDVIGQFGFVDKATIDSNKGKLVFHNTATGDDEQDFIYPKQITPNAENGDITVTYSDSSSKTAHFIYPKRIEMDTQGKITYKDSSGEDNDMGQVVFIDDVFVDSAHQLWIAYTDNTQMENQGIGTGIPLDKNGVPLDNGKTYINYGQTIGTLGIMSGPMPSETDNVDITSIDTIVDWYNGTHTNGQLYGKGDVSGKLHIVTTKPIGDADPISAFIMWDPNMGEAGAWYKVSEIAGAPVGIPAQIGGTLTVDGEESWSYADEAMLADGALRFIQLEENEEPLTTSFPWM